MDGMVFFTLNFKCAQNAAILRLDIVELKGTMVGNMRRESLSFIPILTTSRGVPLAFQIVKICKMDHFIHLINFLGGFPWKFVIYEQF